ncbi:hypothetical protein FJZ41_02430 [Candidatus Shapirobacteria bacterium]|nr:hypothetical protein [Candidatus Shapirobacteria bacterium]
MKKILPVLLAFIFGFCFLKASLAQEFNFDRALNDYLYNYNLYRQSYNEYITAKESYLKYQTLNSKNEALAKTTQMLKNQDEVVKTYLTALRLKLSATPGLSAEEQNVLFLKLDSEVGWFKQHQNSLLSAATLEDLVDSAKKGAKQYQQTEILTYQTLGAILASKQMGFREKIAEQIKALKEKIGEIRLKGDKNTTTAERWLLEAENRLTRSQEKQFEAQQILAKMKATDYNKIKPYNQAQLNLEESHQYLKEANSYLKEILGELKNAD